MDRFECAAEGFPYGGLIFQINVHSKIDDIVYII